VCPCSAQFTRSVHALCSRALFRNVRPHSVRPHSARPHSFGHAGVGPHSGPIIAQSGTLCSVCPCSAQFTRSVHALCSETFGRIMFGRIETVRMRPATTGTTSGQQHRAGSEAAMEAGTELKQLASSRSALVARSRSALPQSASCISCIPLTSCIPFTVESSRLECTIMPFGIRVLCFGNMQSAAV
jgi:hypothetical protein